MDKASEFLFSFGIIIGAARRFLSLISPVTLVYPSMSLIKRIVLYVEELLAHVLERQVLYFADEENVTEFLEYLRRQSAGGYSCGAGSWA